MTREKKTLEDRQTGRDNIRNLFMMAKREGMVFLKDGRALGGGKRAEKFQMMGRGALFWDANNDKHDPRF